MATTNKEFEVKHGLVVAATTPSVSPTTGSLVVKGGAGIAEDLYVGSDVYVTGSVFAESIVSNKSTVLNETTDTATHFLTFVSNSTGDEVLKVDDSDLFYQPSTGSLGIGNSEFLYKFTVGGTAKITNNLFLTKDEPSTSTTSGTLRVTGGAGITENLYVGGNTSVTGNLTVSGGTITAGNVATTLLGENTTTEIIIASGQTSGDLLIGGTLQTGTITVDRSTVAHTLNLGTGINGSGVTKTVNLGTGGSAGSITNISVGSTSGGTTTIHSPSLVVSGNLIVNGTTTTVNTNILTVDDKNIELGSIVSAVVSITGTVGSITGTGPWTAAITGMTNTSGLIPGAAITATNGAGTIGTGGTAVVFSVDSSTSITYTYTGGTAPTTGTVTDITTTGPTDVTADGGGITLKGTTDKTILWVDSTDSWTSNQNFSSPSYTVTGTGNITFADGNTNRGVKGLVGESDYWYIGGGATGIDAGFLEIATGNNKNEPIYVRQYGTEDVRTATLLDASGNTIFPGTVTATQLVSTVEVGTAPLSVASTTVVANLNADLLDSYHAEDFALVGHSHTLTIGDGTDSKLTLDVNTERLNLVAGSNILIAYDDDTNSVTMSATGLSSFNTITIDNTDTEYNWNTADGTQVVTDSVNDQLKIVAGSGIRVSADANNDAIRIEHKDTSSVEDVTAQTNKFVNAITFDTFGHVQTITTGDVVNKTYWLDGTTPSANIVDIQLIDSDAVEDYIRVTGSGSTTVAWDEDTQQLTIDSSYVNTTYTLDGTSPSANVVDLELVGTDSSTDSIRITGSGAATVSWDETNQKLTISATNTTYTISAETETNGASLKLSGADLSTDSVKLIAGSNISITRDDENQITFGSSFTNTTYSLDGTSPSENIVDLELVGTDSSTDSIRIAGIGSTTVSWDEDTQKITIGSTYVNTTYTISAETETGGASLKLSGSDSSADSVILKAGSNISITRDSENQITFGSSFTNTTYSLDGSTPADTTNIVDLQLIGNDSSTDSIRVTGSGSTVVSWSETDQKLIINSTNTDTTYSISAGDGAVTGEKTIILTATGSGSGTDSVTLKAGSNISLARTDDVITINSTYVDTNTDELVKITDETADAGTYYPAFFSSNTGAQSGYVSSTKLTFVPSTGTLSATEINSLSDARFKENIEEISDSFGILEKVQPVKFSWKETGKTAYGVIAQDIETVLPEVVSTNDYGIKSVNYSQLIPLLIAVVKRQQEQIEELNKRLGNQ
jgi:hypothetical protein